MTYHSQEEKLFERWAAKARKLHDSDMIAKDGLLYRGELWWDGLNQVHRPADEEHGPLFCRFLRSFLCRLFVILYIFRFDFVILFW